MIQPFIRRLLIVGSIVMLDHPVAIAQIIPDNSLNTEGSQLVNNVTIKGEIGDRINGGAIRGNNLFHSFQDFNVADGQRLFLRTDVDIQNILTRVTGSNPSNILGTLGVEGAANLFLLNPNGILFGQNARLDLGGSFLATTANALQFGEQGVFSTADRQAPPLLTVNPSALWFNQLQASSIVNRSQTPLGTTPNGIPLRGLQVPQGQSLVLAGGAINFEGGGVNALGGRIDLAAIASPNRAGVPNIVGLATDGNEIKLNVPTEARGDVTFTNGAIANVASGNGGAIVVSARNLTLINARLRAGIEENAGAIDSQAGDIVLNVTEQVLAQQSVLANIVRSGGLGNAGNLQIQTGSLLLSRGTQLFTDTSGTGNAGNIVVEARDRIVLQGADSDEFLSLMNSGIKEGGRGNGGNIRLTTDSLSLTQGTQLISSVSGQGNGGDVILKARDITFWEARPMGMAALTLVEFLRRWRRRGRAMRGRFASILKR
ncbi:MAG: filamentous hemagglutinin N-terminal domain-containing protein [Leptolyngbyaceae cyanobacterium CSU_1_3]|nr:filamentous hemagglutinin N-terminal domain-containing protein [Leptolyngbyaceae cyanobacterium CSU_1_3]